MSEWNRTTIGRFISLQRGHDLPQHERSAGAIPVIGSGGIVGYHDRSIASSPGVTIGRAANLGIPTFIQEDFWPLNTTLYVTNFHGNDVHFTYYLLRTLDLTGFNSGSVQPMLNRNYIAHVPIVVPEANEQRAISSVLGALEDKIAVNERVVQCADKLMERHYVRTIELGGTKVHTVGDVADVFDGPHATPAKTTSGPRFLSISSLNGGRLALRESAHITEGDFKKWTRRVTPQVGDLLFSYETRLGAAALMPPMVRGCLGRRMALLRERHGAVGQRTLLQAFLSKSFQNTIRQRTIHGATVDRIPLTELPSWPIELPAQGSEALENLLSGLDAIASRNDRENDLLATLRDTLLPKLMSGELRVRDAEKVVEEAT